MHIQHPLVADSPPSGEHFVFHSSYRGPEKMFRFTWTLAPGKPGPGEHIHPHESHFFRVVSGELAIFLNGVRHDVRAGDTATIPPGVAHRFKNFGKVPVVIDAANDGASLEDFMVPIAVEMQSRGGKMSPRLFAVMLVQLTATDPNVPVGIPPFVLSLVRGVAWCFTKLGIRPLPPVVGWEAQ